MNIVLKIHQNLRKHLNKLPQILTYLNLDMLELIEPGQYQNLETILQKKMIIFLKSLLMII